MKWLKRQEKVFDRSTQPSTSLDFRMRDVEIHDGVKKEFSVVTQFLVLLHMKPRNVMTFLKLDNEISDQLMTEVVIHFDSRRVVWKQHVPVEVQLTQPNEESICFINSSYIHPIIKDLFGNANQLNDEYEWRPSKRYKVLPEFIERYDDETFGQVVTFLKKHTATPEVGLNTANWFSLEELRQSLLIRYLAHHCEEVYVWIDDAHDVRGIEFV